jgi:hypothetical protein
MKTTLLCNLLVSDCHAITEDLPRSSQQQASAGHASRVRFPGALVLGRKAVQFCTGKVERGSSQGSRVRIDVDSPSSNCAVQSSFQKEKYDLFFRSGLKAARCWTKSTQSRNGRSIVDRLFRIRLTEMRLRIPSEFAPPNTEGQQPCTTKHLV